MSKGLIVNMLLREEDSGKLYRLLWLSDDQRTAYIFNITDNNMPISISCAELLAGIENGAHIIEATDPYFVAVSEETLTDKEKETRDNVWAFIEPIVQNEPDIFIKKERGRILKEAVNQTSKKLFTFHRYLKTYWKCGKTKNAFIPRYENSGAPGKQRKAGETKLGRPSKYGNTGINADDATRAIFEKAVKKYYHNRNEHTFKYAYNMMIAEHYTQYIVQPDGKKKAGLIPTDLIPTIRQFRYWYSKTYDIKESITQRKGKTKFELKHRAVLGKSDHGIMGSGAKYQIDATVGDIYLAV